MSIWHQKIAFSCQGRGYVASDFISLLVLSSGGFISSDYFRLLELPVSELIYHLEVLTNARRIEEEAAQWQEKQKSIAKIPGFSNLNFVESE